MMKKYIFGFLTACLLLSPTSAGSQTLKRVGVLVAHDQFIPAFEGFKTKMAELGYIEGKNIFYDFNNAHANTEVLEALAKKLAQDKPELIVASSASAAFALSKATKGTNIPIVFLSVANPLKFAQSYNSSGNNFTGISTSTIDLTEKRMELLKELIPGIKKAISLNHIHGLNYEDNLRATREAGKRLGIDLVEVAVESPEELMKRAPLLLTRKIGEAIILPPDSIVAATQKIILPVIIRERLPSIASSIENVRAGALMSYAADYFALGEQGATLAENILKGARPSDLPIQSPFKLKLVVNLSNAHAIGLKVPKEILVRADEVIE